MMHDESLPKPKLKRLRTIGKAFLQNSVVHNHLQRLLHYLITYSATRPFINYLYQKLSHVPQFNVIVFEYFSNILQASDRPPDKGTWSIDFAGKRVLLPLSPDRPHLDWAVATSVLGHDTEIKQTYATLLLSSSPPDLFIDIGGNMGTHSLLFLVHGIETLTFEPNQSCHPYFQEACALNGVTSKLESVALGETRRTVELYYPEGQTWLGSTNSTTQNRLSPSQTLLVQSAQQTTLDDYRSNFFHRRLLIKIDTEGNELQILQGGVQTLQQQRPIVIFECWSDKDSRTQLFKFFEAQSYCIANLPWCPPKSAQLLTIVQFLDSPWSNFIALPQERATDTPM